jgi:hypothetical protein
MLPDGVAARLAAETMLEASRKLIDAYEAPVRRAARPL